VNRLDESSKDIFKWVLRARIEKRISHGGGFVSQTEWQVVRNRSRQRLGDCSGGTWTARGTKQKYAQERPRCELEVTEAVVRVKWAGCSSATRGSSGTKLKYITSLWNLLQLVRLGQGEMTEMS
jgi:hypothetical protein